MEFLAYLRVHWDRAAAVGCALAGFALLIIGYAGVSDTEYISEQLPYVISDGFGALMLLTLAAALWISADLRDEWRELAEQGEELRAVEERRREDLQRLVEAEVDRQLGTPGAGR